MAELSGLEVLVLMKEIESALRGSYVNNIFSLGDSQVLRFRKPGGDEVRLVASPSRGMWVSESISERGETTEFTSRLRGRLERARFVAARQLGLDRIFEVSFDDGSGATLVVELMPPGNVLVVGPDRIVLETMREVRTPKRRVARGSPYLPPPQTRSAPTELSAESMQKFLAEEKTVGKAIGRHVALPKKYVADVLARLSLRDETPSTELKGRESEVVQAVHKLFNDAASSPVPCVATTPDGDEIFAVVPAGFPVKEEADSVSSLCDRYLLPEVLREAESSTDPDEAKRNELGSTIANLKAQQTALMKKGESLRVSADKAMKADGLEEAGRILAESGVHVRRQMTTNSAIASVLYDAAKEAETKAKDAGKAAERLAKRSPKPTKKYRQTKELSHRKQDWFEKFRWFNTSGGKLAIGGRDAQTNSILIRRHLEDNDTVFHADLFGSPFFILKGGRSQTEDEAREVAQATIAFSSAWKTGLGAADAYWVGPEQVSTAAPSGEYLAKGSFAIKGRKNYVEKNIVELAVGVGAGGRLLAGPESSLKQQAGCYVVLRPQREKGSETAKRVLKDLTQQDCTSVGGLNLDEVLRALPAGGGKVVRKVGGGKSPDPAHG